AHDGIKPEPGKADAGAADVDDGIDAADLVKVDVVRCCVVDFGFGDGEALEHLQGGGFDLVVELRLFDERADGRPGAGVCVICRFDGNASAVDAVLTDVISAETIPFDAELAELGGDVAEADAGIDKRTENHVAAGAGEGIEVSDVHGTFFRDSHHDGVIVAADTLEIQHTRVAEVRCNRNATRGYATGERV